MASDFLALAAGFAQRDGRRRTADRLAAHLGAAALLFFVHDRDVGALVPAPGFPPTLPGGAGWPPFLAAAARDGRHAGRVGFPAADTLVRVEALTGHGITAVVVLADDAAPDERRLEELRVALPLFAAILHAEFEVEVARGEQAAARNYARDIESLAASLDTSRLQLEHALADLQERTRAFDEARERAEQATRAKDEFLAMLGHELRNPLAPIVTALQILRLRQSATREHEVIERQVRHLLRLVDDLLDVSRITRGKVELDRRPVEIADVAARAIEMSSPELERKQQTLDVHVPSAGLVVSADAARLAQVLANLLINAAKYSPAGTRILLSAAAEGAVVRIRVKDEGAGIDPASLERIFGLFEQLDRSADRPESGLGLGLAIVQNLVSLHGGTVRAYSEGAGTGSEFVVELPRVLAPMAAESGAGEGPAVSSRTGRPLPRILIVDDNTDAGELLADALATVGYDVRTAHDGPSALSLARALQPEVAIVDIGLPVMDGYDVARQLRQVLAGRPLTLIALTGYGQQAHRERSQEAGFADHLIKPVRLEQLTALLDRLGASRAAARD